MIIGPDSRMASTKKIRLDSLFDVEYENTQPLRKYEPLIRFNLDGKPLPQRLLDHNSINLQPALKQDPVPEQKPEPKPQQKQFNDRKRSPPPTTEPRIEPKKKQPKEQSKITAFFRKS